MSAWLAGAGLLVGVILLCRFTGMVPAARRVMQSTREALVVMGDLTLPDEDKESAMQELALRLLRLFLWILAAGLVAVLLPVGMIWGLDELFGVVELPAVLDLSLSWEFLLAAALFGSLLWWLMERPAKGQREPEAGFRAPYSWSERFLHELAFALTPVQLLLSRLEDRLTRKRRRGMVMGEAVFIAGLPRAGTTILLNLLSDAGGFYSHSYRRLPFLLTPLFWERFSRLFRKEGGMKERVHGDGVLVGLDSPEAFEEVLWMSFWKPRYTASQIELWREDEAHAAFLRFFRAHLEKLALLQGGEDTETPRRYLSKNNLNIARLPWIVRQMPAARIVVPFREPLQQAASLLRQHRRFLEMHRQDPFAAFYMRSIGHFDFGENLRPVGFEPWLVDVEREKTLGLEFWIRYWTASYRSLLGSLSPQVFLLDFDALCAEPLPELAKLAAFLRIDAGGWVEASAPKLRQLPPRRVNLEGISAEVLAAARGLHAELRQRCLRPDDDRQALRSG